ncbi:hypothetical protein Tco_1475093 [Tanacetum coccineum]
MSSSNASPTVNNVTSPNTTVKPLAFHTSPSPFYSMLSSPPGFPINPSAQTIGTQLTYNLGQPAHNLGQPTSYAQPSQQDRVGQSGQSTTGQQSGQLSRQETTLPYVFNALMHLGPSAGNWNKDTGFPNSSGSALLPLRLGFSALQLILLVLGLLIVVVTPHYLSTDKGLILLSGSLQLHWPVPLGNGTAKNWATVLAVSISLHWSVPLRQ